MVKFSLGVALAMVVLTGSVHAQHSAQKATIGIKGGLNIYNIHTNSSADFTTKLGFNAGLLAHVHLLPHLALQPEVVFSRQGVRGSGTGAKFRNDLDYINVPVLVQVMFDNGFRIEAGPQVGFLVSAKQKADNTPSRDIKNNFKSMDFGVSGGVSYVHPSTGFGVDARYNLGLTNINNIGTLKETNRGAQIGIFYLLHHRH